MIDIPDEILIRIFMFAASGRGSDKEPLKIIHVCRLWRELALGTSALWNVAVSPHPECIEHYLDHARARPLYVVTDNADAVDGLVRRMPELLSHTQFRSFEFLLPYTAMQKMLPLLPTNLPTLRSLRLRIQKDSIGNSNDFKPPLELQTPLNPELLYLHLQHMFFRSLAEDTHIRRLLMLNEGYFHDPAPTLDEFLAVLRKCRKLEHLHLQGSGPAVRPDLTTYPKSIRPPVHLSRLNYLKLNLRHVDSARILAHLIVPAEAHIKCLACLPVNDVYFADMLPRYSERRLRGPVILPHLTTAVVTRDIQERTPRVKVQYFVRDVASRAGAFGLPAITLNFCWKGIDKVCRDFHHRFLDTARVLAWSIRATIIRDVHIRCNLFCVANGEWRCILWDFREVTSLCFSHHDPSRSETGDPCQILLELDHHVEPICPKLRRLHFTNVPVNAQFPSLAYEILTRRTRVHSYASLELLTVQEPSWVEHGPMWPIFPADVVGAFHYTNAREYGEPFCTCSRV